MSITITAFEMAPDRGQGQARDMRIRWALEEVGQSYDVRLVSFVEMNQPAHLARQPFGQIPTYEEDGLVLFESGAIVLHIAVRFLGLISDDEESRARAIAWMFAAQTTMEPPILERETAGFLEHYKDWHSMRLPMMDERIEHRLRQLSDWLGDGDWLDGEFSAGDLAMIGVLRRLNDTPLLKRHANLSAYVNRGEARPAFKRAFAAQRAVFEARTTES
ncbi:MAG: glutathione S-transferase family protein [Jannaschia sp.]